MTRTEGIYTKPMNPWVYTRGIKLAYFSATADCLVQSSVQTGKRTKLNFMAAPCGAPYFPRIYNVLASFGRPSNRDYYYLVSGPPQRYPLRAHRSLSKAFRVSEGQDQGQSRSSQSEPAQRQMQANDPALSLVHHPPG